MLAMRNIIIGDVHGCLDELKELINKLEVSIDCLTFFILKQKVNKWCP